MRKNRSKCPKVRWRRALAFYIMALPGLLYLILNNYIPMFGILIAFKRMNFQKGILASPWCGLDNFKFLFSSASGWEMMRNTIGYSIGSHILGTVCAITVAILINEIAAKKLKSVYQSVMLLPFMISWVIISYVGYAYLSGETGLINKAILEPLGLQPVIWYQEPKYWPFILLFAGVWKGIGYSMIVYLSSIVGINSDYYEAARIDGAGKWRQIRSITLPLLKPTVITLSILALGGLLSSDFGLFYQLPRGTGLLMPVTRTLDVYVYQALMQNADYGMSSATSVFQAVVGFILIVGSNLWIKRVEPGSAIF